MRFKAFEISREQIITATKNVYPDKFDGRNKFYVELHGRKYPVKQPIHIVTKLPKTGGFISDDARRVLKKLGFSVHKLSDSDGLDSVVGPNKPESIDGALKFAVTLRPGEDGFIIASAPALPGCHSQGRTEEEAIANIREAIRGYIASMRRHGEEIPSITEVREVEVPV
jgi:antitoxin HicB